MSEEKRQRLSALVDGELPWARAVGALDDVLGDDGLKRCWERYHLIGDVLRREHGDADAANLAERVHTAVAVEPSQLVKRRFLSQIRAPVMRPLAGIALAASVATVAIIGVRTFNQDPTAPPTVVATPADSPPATPAIASSMGNFAPITVTARSARPTRSARSARSGLSLRVTTAAQNIQDDGFDSRVTRRQWNELKPDVAERLNGYLVNHTERLGNSMGGILPYARIVGYDAGD